MIQIRKFTFNYFQENSYLVWNDDRSCAIIDPGFDRPAEKAEFFDFIEKEGLTPEAVLLTHAHLDHIYGVSACVRKYGIPVYMDEREELTINSDNVKFTSAGLREPERFEYVPVSDGMTVEIAAAGKEALCARALSTPGHSAGGLCWWFEAEKTIFTGDTLFAGTVGRTDSGHGSLDVLLKSLRDTLMQIDGETDVCPGHGPATSIGRERTTNPFIYEWTS